MGDIRDLPELYLRLVAARIRAQLQYRASFAMETFGTLLVSFIDFVAILVIFANVPQLGSWSMPEVALLYGISGLAFAITDLILGHLDDFPRLVRDGNFDLLLVRPRGTLFQILTGDFQLHSARAYPYSPRASRQEIPGIDRDWRHPREQPNRSFQRATPRRRYSGPTATAS